MFFKKAKLDKNYLTMAMDSVEQAYRVYDASHLDELIFQTGKSRQALIDEILADDEVLSCRDDVFTAVLAKDWRIWGKDVDEDVINKLYKMVRRLLGDFVDLAVLSFLTGFAVAEYVFKADEDGFLMLDKVLSKEGELDEYQVTRHGDVVYQNDVLLNQELKFLVLRSRAVPARPRGEMRLVRAYPAICMRKRGWAYASQFIARYAQPYVVGKQSGLMDLDKFTEILYSFVNGGAAGVGQDDEISVHQLSGNGEAFDLLERMANKRIQKLILGRVKTSELSSGSRSAQETDDKVRSDRLRGYMDLVAVAVQHAINAVLKANALYGVNIFAPQGLWFEHVEQTPVDVDRATRDKIYIDSGLITLNKDYFVNILGYEEQHIQMLEPNQDDARFALSDDGKVSKLKTMMSWLESSRDYAEFEKKLSHLPDDGFAQVLAEEMAKQYVNGLAGAEYEE